MRLSISKRNNPEKTSCLFAPPERGDLQWRDETVRAAGREASADVEMRPTPPETLATFVANQTA